MFRGYEVFWHIRSILVWSQSVIAILPSNPLINKVSPLISSIFLGQTVDLMSGLQCTEDTQQSFLPEGLTTT